MLEDGIASRAADIDVIYLTGYGFPGYRGGPMFCADQIGLAKILSRVEAFHRELGQRWAPAPLLARLAKAGSTFREFDAVTWLTAFGPSTSRRPTSPSAASGDVVYMQSRRPLGAYPARITERLEYWADRAPDRVFLAQRDATGAWCRVTYAETLSRVRALSQALLDRRLSSDRPVLILSGNGIEHGLLALAAMFSGVLYAPIAPAYSLQAKDYGTLGQIFERIQPGLVFAAEGARLRARAEPRAAEGRRARRVVAQARRADVDAVHAVCRARGRRARRPPWTTPTRGSARTRLPRSCSRRARRAGRKASSTRSACCARTRK